MKRTLAALAACLVVTLAAASERPSPGPAGPETAAAGARPAPVGSPVNVNTAGVQELMTLPGIGPALAGRIVEHRKQNGPFRRAEDMLAVKGVGPKLLGKIRDRLAFDAPGGAR